MLGDIRLNNLVNSGPAPGNKFPSFGDAGGGYTPRQWQQLQDQRDEHGFNQQVRLMNIANKLKTRGNTDPGNPNNAKNVVYNMAPEIEARDRKDKMQMFGRTTDLKEKELDTNTRIEDERTRYGRIDSDRNYDINRLNAQATREKLLRDDVEWKDVGGEYIGYNTRTGQRIGSQGQTGNVGNRQLQQERFQHEDMQNYLNRISQQDMNNADNATQREIWSGRNLVAGVNSPAEAHRLIQNKAIELYNIPKYRDLFTWDGTNFSLNTDYSNDPRYAELQQLLWPQQQQGPALNAGPSTPPNVTGVTPRPAMPQVPMARSHSGNSYYTTPSQPSLGSIPVARSHSTTQGK